MKKKKPSGVSKKDWKDVESPELKARDFRRMRPAGEIVPKIVAAYARERGRPAGQTKTQVTLRLDKQLVRELRKNEGWQTRVNALLNAAFGLTSPDHHAG